MGCTIALLAHRPDLIPTLAAGYRAAWPDWYGANGPGDAEADLRERASARAIPLGVVALEGRAAVGTAALTAVSIASRAYLTPWLTGLWVHPGARGRGVASAMITALAKEARSCGVVRLHTATEHGRALFERLGWTVLETLDEDGHALTVLVLDLA